MQYPNDKCMEFLICYQNQFPIVTVLLLVYNIFAVIVYTSNIDSIIVPYLNRYTNIYCHI